MSISNVTARDHRANARAMLGGQIFKTNWIMALVITLVYSLIMGAVATFTGGIGTLIFTGPMVYGLLSCYVLLSRSGKAEIVNLFNGFKHDFAQTLLIGLMTSIFTSLWSLLFVIPGIVKSYAYKMAPYIKLDHPEWDWRACMDESQRIMNGNKWKLFCLELSFIGWFIVCMFTFGIGYLWVTPYVYAAQTSFYETIKE